MFINPWMINDEREILNTISILIDLLHRRGEASKRKGEGEREEEGEK